MIATKGTYKFKTTSNFRKRLSISNQSYGSDTSRQLNIRQNSARRRHGQPRSFGKSQQPDTEPFHRKTCRKIVRESTHENNGKQTDQQEFPVIACTLANHSRWSYRFPKPPRKPIDTTSCDLEISQEIRSMDRERNIVSPLIRIESAKPDRAILGFEKSASPLIPIYDSC